MSKLLNEAEVRKLIPIGHSKYYELIGSGELRSVKVGRRRFVSEQAVADYIDALDQAA
ncbi:MULTISPECIES: helix-turn-helix domain-containing protein [Nocardia]|uniref:helix-turn-helix domain-containing protein n=1 Tax=Nocardia TaxID=1817 RepID=UPI000CEA2758|nr:MULTISPECIES: helix-turn-helix domain-containing protein [Nocardia]MBV7701881.1 helix-turn-helix domain-containing protein [Nocardia nova]PPI94500.1 excisionase [Nocardia nova]PPJ05902.1 excisionase [Nocardia nova]